ncbi:MAG: FAD-dependent oxidoreductase [Elainellaceae cyanobacterium]
MSTVSDQAQVQTPSTHALVIGGSMAGLLSARVLADHFDQVTLVERDRFPETPEFRPGVPQSNHVHVLLTRGQQLLEQLFPNLLDDLTASGAPTLDWTADWPWLGFWGWEPRFHSGLIGRTCSRTLLEWLVRQRLETFGNIKLLDGCQVKGVLSTGDRTRVTGIKLTRRHRQREAALAQTETITADLTVDASGRNSILPEWLEVLGYPAVQETVVNSFLGYGSRWYQRPEKLDADWQGLLIAPKPPQQSRGGVLYPVEGNCWVVTLSGIGDDHPPIDEDGFLGFARSLRNPILYDLLKDAKPLSPVYSYRRTENCLRHYDKLTRFPDGVVALGDAVCAFNPVHGQGMTVAALGAITLQECVRDQLTQTPGDLRGLPLRFQKQLAQIVATPWMMATGEDFRWKTTEGGKPDWTTRLMHRYIDQLAVVSLEKPEVFQTFVEVMHMLKPPTALFKPNIAAQVVKQAISGQKPHVTTDDEYTIPRIRD